MPKPINMKYKNLFKDLNDKGGLKQEVYASAQAAFSLFKKELNEIVEEFNATEHHSKVELEYQEDGEFVAKLKFGSDYLFFYLHSNVFATPIPGEKDASKAVYAGAIHIYNFLADSIKYKRFNDLGILIGRIFITNEGAYFVEGDRLDLKNLESVQEVPLDDKTVEKIIEKALYASLQIDLVAPEMKQVEIAELSQMISISNQSLVQTSKPIGFQFLKK